MRLFGLTITKAAQNLVPVYQPSLFGLIRESFTGAWQKNITVESTQNVLAFSAIRSCISLIAGAISPLRICLEREADDGVWDEVDQSPFLPVLRKPNRYQTRIQFLKYWIVTKLIHGNAYVLLSRDNRGVVDEMYPLDPRCVTPLVAPDGSVYYQLRTDLLSGIIDSVTVPSSEIIHDRMDTLFHPLIGVSPIYSCAVTATQGIRIQNNSAKFFENMSRPSGHLSAPGVITPQQQTDMKKSFEENFGSGNLGRLFVTGGGLKYEAMTIPAQDAQLIEQLKWTIEDVARCFHVPLHKIQSGQNVTFNNVGAMNQAFYDETLKGHIEEIELLLDEALGLPALGMGVELEISGLLRMDPKARAETQEIQVRSATICPDEARLEENRHPVPGGNTPYMQQQNYSLAALAKRDASADPFGTAKPPAPAVPVTPDPSAIKAWQDFRDKVVKGLECQE